MKRKILGMLMALVLATGGTLALVAYVKSAKDEAVAGEELVDVYVLGTSLDKGATALEIRDALRKEQVPAKVRADDAITDPSVIGDDAVAAVALREGEQLLASRLVEEKSLTRIVVPDGLQEVTVALEPQRAVGGVLRPGDTVGVVLSFDPFEIDASGRTATAVDETTDTTLAPTDAAPSTTAGPTQTPNVTHLTFQQVLVTQVQFVSSGSGSPLGGDDTDNTSDDVGTAPETDVLVTLALNAAQVEQLVFAAEFGHIWLTAENDKADTSGTRVVTLGEVYDPEVML